MIHCAVAVIEKDGKILISQRRAEDSFGLHWEFPGGSCEEGESLEACVAREAAEEVGLAVVVDRFIMKVENPYRHKVITLHFFLCRAQGEKPPQALECAECRWVRPEELKNYLFPPANEKVIAFLVESQARAGR